jgi:long-chain acyl-CoA synthetase
LNYASGGPRPAPGTLTQIFLDAVERHDLPQAYQFKRDGAWLGISHRQLVERVRHVSLGLTALGVKRGDRVGIMSENRPEWAIADWACLGSGMTDVPIYSTLPAEQIVHPLNDSGAVVLFVSTVEQAAKAQSVRAELKSVRKIISFVDPAPEGVDLTFRELEASGAAIDSAGRAAEWKAGALAVRPDDLATLIYTSGTTGLPKGVELTHDNWVYEGEAIDELGLLGPDDVQYLWLPLAHSFGKVLEVAQLKIGFPTAIDGRVDKIVENLAVVRPTFVAAVPRIFEKVHARVVSSAQEGGAVKAGIFRWALSVGRRAAALERRGKQPGRWLQLRRALADRLVFSKLRDRFGGRLRFFISGSAPLSRDLAEFFHAAGILILEGYGLTESSAASFVNVPSNYEFGTVGPPLPGTELKIAEDGEILIGGRGIMRGYHNLPEATAEALDGRWLRTGDIGAIDERGLLTITDRKKDLIKTAGGKYVAPQLVEGKLKAICPYVSQVVVHGDRRKYCSALVSFDEEALKKWAAERGLTGTYAELSARPEAHALLEPFIKELNAGLPSYSTIKKFAILPHDLSAEEGELTPSLKVKRKAVEKKFAALLDSLYA